jgi:hypothetical protein
VNAIRNSIAVCEEDLENPLRELSATGYCDVSNVLRAVASH